MAILLAKAQRLRILRPSGIRKEGLFYKEGRMAAPLSISVSCLEYKDEFNQVVSQKH